MVDEVPIGNSRSKTSKKERKVKDDKSPDKDFSRPIGFIGEGKVASVSLKVQFELKRLYKAKLAALEQFKDDEKPVTKASNIARFLEEGDEDSDD